ncbi:hypothetical protein B2K_38415 [Paenibacillus mucilaginosus K02]|uniref:Uncharacterized protein n=1 Tax=Paenibacillus mucilaginosus K02 TaxID=997761 RepID=R9UPL0_9BACL|nr:hypothetical protein B2K_38415 [Paenibacillus mucilaginosus K02]
MKLKLKAVKMLDKGRFSPVRRPARKAEIVMTSVDITPIDITLNRIKIEL